MRENGLQRPFHWLQVLAWALFPFFLDSILWRPDAALLVVALGVVGDNRIHARCIRNVVSSLAHVKSRSP